MSAQTIPHGTVSRYKKGCRCAACRAEHSSYNRIWWNRFRRQAAARRRSASAAGPYVVEGIRHGYNGYANHHCRCEICREANRISCQRYRQRHQEQAGASS